MSLFDFSCMRGVTGCGLVKGFEVLSVSNWKDIIAWVLDIIGGIVHKRREVRL